MSELFTDDAHARQRALDPATSFIVQAPAGSGKTELLIQRFLVLLAAVAQPESVLAITFTRKAAAEMRQRIFVALREAQRPGTEKHPPRAETLALARAVVARDRERGWRLLERPGRLRIQTIDALNFALARRLPILSGLGAEFSIDEDPGSAYRLAAERLLLHLADRRSAHGRAVAEVLEHLDNRAQGLVELIEPMLARREAWMPLLPSWRADDPDERELRAHLDAARAVPVTAHLRRLTLTMPREVLEEARAVAVLAAQALHAAGTASPILAARDAAAIADADAASLPVWRALAELLLTSKGAARSRLDAKIGLGAKVAGQETTARAKAVIDALSAVPEAMKLLHGVRTLPTPFYDDQEWRSLAALRQALQLAVAELHLVFAERGTLDYPRVAEAARAALGSEDEPTDTALALDARLQHLLVDEFQDTSEAQVRLLQRLTAGWSAGDGCSVFLVGDPMQSIYRFRNAEVGLYLAVRDQGLGALPLETLRLAVNFRSTRPLVEWVNRAFAAILPAEDDLIYGAVSHAPSTAAPDAGDGGRVQVHASVGRDPELEARCVVDLVAARLAEKDDARIAILVQGRAHLAHIVPELQRRQIAFRATDIDPLADRPVVRDLLALTRLIALPADRTAGLAVLRGPWCGLRLAEMLVLSQEDADPRESSVVPQWLHDETRLARVTAPARERVRRCLCIVEHAMRERATLGLHDAVLRAWQSLGGPTCLREARELDEAQAYFAGLAKLEHAGHGRVDLTLLEDALPRLYAPTVNQAEARVELMTIHRAKGLEFDTVIVPGLERGPGRETRQLLRWSSLPDPVQEWPIVAPIAAHGGAGNELYDWLKRLDRERLEHERCRLLYVAATRAEHTLHLFGSALPGAAQSPADARPPPRSALKLLWPAVAAHYAGLATAAPAEDPRAAAITPVGPPLRRVPDDWTTPLPTPGPALPAWVPAVIDDTEDLPFDWASETARHVGTVVHRALQDCRSVEHLHTAADSTLGTRYGVELAELGVPPDRLAAAVTRVLAALSATAADARGRWLFAADHAEVRTELALSGRIGRARVRAVIDRSFVDAAGVRWIVDYKTSTHEGGGREQFLDEQCERYRPQLQRYALLLGRLTAQPVRVGLYFPQLSAWREWQSE